MFGLSRTIVISVGFFLVLDSAAAGWFGTDFSADTYQVSAQGQVVQGRMFVGNGKVRTEMTSRDNVMVEIIDPEKGVAWLLEPASKSYRERLVPKKTAAEGPDSPCEGMISADCRYLGEEVLNGRASHKWQIDSHGKQLLQWRDREHRFPVKIVEDGRPLMEMQFVARDSIAGRQVENWLATQYTAQGAFKSSQWYDPQLNLAIRQVMPDGSLRELRNIRIEAQPQGLFELPGEFRLKEAR